MVELESMANQGHISRPGAWSFPDCLEVGTPGPSSLTWEESKSNVALFAVTSSPLILGNDPREGRMQVSTLILGRRTAPSPPFRIPGHVPHGFNPRSWY